MCLPNEMRIADVRLWISGRAYRLREKFAPSARIWRVVPTTLQCEVDLAVDDYRREQTKRRGRVTRPSLLSTVWVCPSTAHDDYQEALGRMIRPVSESNVTLLKDSFFESKPFPINLSPNFFMESLFTLFRSFLLSGNIPANWIPFSGSRK